MLNVAAAVRIAETPRMTKELRGASDGSNKKEVNKRKWRTLPS